MRGTRFIKTVLGLCFAGVFCCGEINGEGGVGVGAGLGGDQAVGSAPASSQVDALLPRTLVLASGTYSATARFVGDDASASGWTDRISGTTLTLGGTGTDPSYQQSTTWTTPKGVLFNTGKSFIAPNNTFLNVAAAEDFVVEVVIRHTTVAAEKCWLGKSVGGSLGPLLLTDSGNVGRAYGPTTPALNVGAFATATNYHIMWFADANGNVRAYKNGVANGAAVRNGTVMNESTPFTLGSYNNGGSGKFNGVVSLVNWWTLPSGSVGSDANCDAVAAARYAAAQAAGFAP